MGKFLLLVVTFVAFSFVSIDQFPHVADADELKDLEQKLQLLNEKKKPLEKRKIADLSGSWEARLINGDGACSSLHADRINIDEGKTSILVSHPQDGPFSFETAIFDDGKFKGFAAGSYVGVDFTGYFKGNSGELKATISGEELCHASWMLTKK